jgi:predicted SAM-dependent methyltransferase
MISRTAKATFYVCMGVPMRVSAWTYRHFRAPRTGDVAEVKVHLGPGQEKYLPGWINVDANIVTAKLDVWADLRWKLPFRDASVDAFYSHHVIEHLPDHLLPMHFAEMFRCLKPGGVIRVGGPDGENAARKFIEGDRAWFHDFPDRRNSIGGAYVNFIICRNEHLTILSYSYLQELAGAAGFTDVVRCAPIRETHHRQLFGDVLDKEFEPTPDVPHTLLIEAQRPGVRRANGADVATTATAAPDATGKATAAGAASPPSP